MANGNEVGIIQGYRGRITSLAFTTDGKRLVSGMDDTTATGVGLESKAMTGWWEVRRHISKNT